MSKRKKRVASKDLLTGEIVVVPVIDIYNTLSQIQREPLVQVYNALVRMLELKEPKQ